MHDEVKNIILNSMIVTAHPRPFTFDTSLDGLIDPERLQMHLSDLLERPIALDDVLGLVTVQSVDTFIILKRAASGNRSSSGGFFSNAFGSYSSRSYA